MYHKIIQFNFLKLNIATFLQEPKEGEDTVSEGAKTEVCTERGL